MNDEIKEILDNIKNKYEDYYVQDIVSGNDLKQLLDYITNLQQENERLKENNLDMQEEMARTWQKCDDYKSRCEKAIEYIKNCEIVDKDKRYPLLEEQFGEDLLNILQNGSEKDEN